MLRRLATGVASVSILALATPARAGNEPDKAQQRAEHDLLPKLIAACGAPLSLSYDGASLRKNKPASVEEWLEDRPTRAKHWSDDGKLISDDEFEPDGSRKLKH